MFSQDTSIMNSCRPLFWFNIMWEELINSWSKRVIRIIMLFNITERFLFFFHFTIVVKAKYGLKIKEEDEILAHGCFE